MRTSLKGISPELILASIMVYKKWLSFSGFAKVPSPYPAKRIV